MDPARLAKAIERAISAIVARASSLKVEELTTTLHGLRATLADVTTPNPALWIRHRSGLMRVEIEDIVYATAERDYVQLHLTEKTCL